MTATIEKQMNALLEKASKMVQYLSSIKSYDPKSPHESPEHLSSLREKLELVHQDEKERSQIFPQYWQLRKDVFSKACRGMKSVMHLFHKGVNRVTGLREGTVRQFETIVSDVNHACGCEQQIDFSEEAVEKSVQSFGSLAESFEEVVGSLKGSDLMSSEEEKAEVADLSIKVAQMNRTNSDVLLSFQDFQNYRKLRDETYLELKRRLRHVKKHVERQFGQQSQEFQILEALY